MIEVNDLAKSYGTVRALEGVSFQISSGEIVGLLGPNGAGKTTIIKILTGYLQPDQGDVHINGLDVLSHPREVQAQIGYLPENAPLYPELNVQAYLRMIAELRGIPESEHLIHISEAVRSVGLEDFLTRPIGELSKGYRQRVGLAQAIIHKPALLILDEPTVGLDPTQIVEIRSLIRRLASHSTVLFSTHILPEVEALCNRAIILLNGEIKADSNLADLASSPSSILVLDKKMDGIDRALKDLKGVNRVESFSTEQGFPAYRVDGDPDSDLSPAVFQLAAQNGWPVREVRRDVRMLEAVFNELVIAGEGVL